MEEGLDLPDVDTVLFLRPPESAALFLQQLGPGLRRTRDKAVLTVLELVGHHRKEFRFDRRLRALTAQTGRGLKRDIELGFPFLPSGCQIVMDRQSQQIVLENISEPGWQPLVAGGRRTSLLWRRRATELPDGVGTRAVRRAAAASTPLRVSSTTTRE
jgi:hypothetical protein